MFIGISISAVAAAIRAILTNLFVDESGNYLTDEAGNRLGE